jgi:hypothetical protein
MTNTKSRICAAIAAVVVAGAVTFGLEGVNLNMSGIAMAATAQQKSDGRQALRDVLSSLRSVDTSYASGNAAEAQSHFDQARSNWNKIAPIISAREAREAQLLFDSLGNQLKGSAPATRVKATVNGMLGEFREDIQRELR